MLEGLTEAKWRTLGEQLAGYQDVLQWAWGDWWLHGQRAYGEAAEKALPSGIHLATLRNYAVVARAIESSRRREHLTFSHHALVAPLSASEQDELLDAAEFGKWTTRMLATEIGQRKALAEQAAAEAEGLALAAGTEPKGSELDDPELGLEQPGPESHRQERPSGSAEGTGASGDLPAPTVAPGDSRADDVPGDPSAPAVAAEPKSSTEDQPDADLVQAALQGEIADLTAQLEKAHAEIARLKTVDPKALLGSLLKLSAATLVAVADEQPPATRKKVGPWLRRTADVFDPPLVPASQNGASKDRPLARRQVVSRPKGAK
ncbi:MAG: hypothetical protein V4472_24905 [Pseudomonadota bacterium]